MSYMTPRQRVGIALKHQEPDRVPWDISLNIYSFEKLSKYLNVPMPKNLKPDVESAVGMSFEMIRALGTDLYHFSLNRSSQEEPFNFEADTYEDEWGVGFRKVNYGRGYYYWELSHHPLEDATLEDIETYSWPDPEDPHRVAGLRERIQEIYQNTSLALVGKFNVPPFTQAFYLRGFERWLMDLALNQKFANALLAKITEISVRLDEIGMKEVGEYISILRFAGDDFGAQDRMLISPSMWRDIIAPHLAKLYDSAQRLIRRYSPGAKLLIHTDGDIYPIIPDLIDMGVDVLNCVDPVGKMDHVKLKSEFGDALSFHGGLGMQDVFTFGSPSDVDQLVRKCIMELGPGGGYILAPTNFVLPDVPPENVIAIRDAVMRWGKYPLNKKV